MLEPHECHSKPEVVVAKVEARNMGKERLENFIAEVGVMIEYRDKKTSWRRILTKGKMGP